jgi:hypothetical protein
MTFNLAKNLVLGILPRQGGQIQTIDSSHIYNYLDKWASGQDNIRIHRENLKIK